MYPNRNSFISYAKLNGGQVWLVNLSCEILGFSNVQLQMHDGFVKILTKVRHCTRLKKKFDFCWYA